MEFSEKVKFARKKLYLSQDSLAKQIGISFVTINRWENGHGHPNLVMEAKFNDFCEKNGIKFEDRL